MDNITDNEVLAVFDGATPCVIYVKSIGDVKGYECEQYNLAVDELDFNVNWQSLMPVWYKFRALAIHNRLDLVHYKNHMIRIENAIIHKGPSPAEACKLLAEGIKWYNSIKK